jgi:carbamoyl-phosphate synthase small subunit
MQTAKAALLLQDGTYFTGNAFGKIGTTTGEICFNTGMTGYQEIFTDPSYFGQIMITNNVHIGNYGIKQTEAESDSIKINGLVGLNLEEKYSRKQANEDLQQYLSSNHIVSIAGIDTRSLVAHIRSKGAMNAIISSENTHIDFLQEQLAKCPNMEGLELASQVSTNKVYSLGNDSYKKVAVLDFGIKQSILNCMVQRGLHVTVFPAKTSFAELQQLNADAYFISNGPGDPAPMHYAVETIKQILETNKPLFGICLGHQLLALANGVGTFKMHHGHRGLNHPVKNIITGQCEITSQNHGFGIKAEDVKNNAGIEITHLNLNDNSIEGIRIKGKKAFSVQYHPEASPGPHDSRYLFDDFIAMMN